MKKCKDCKRCDPYIERNAIEYDTAYGWCEAKKKDVGVIVWECLLWAPKVFLITLALVLGGCTTWDVDKTAYRLDGSIESRTRASMNQWLTDSTRTKVAVEINDIGKAEIGSSVLDAESLAEIIKALPEGLRKEILALLGIGL